MNELRPPVTASRLRQGWFELMLDETRFLQCYPHYAGVLARMDPIRCQYCEGDGCLPPPLG